MIKEVYRGDYDAGIAEFAEWVVRGPGTYIRFGSERNAAHELASRLNNAYILGYATKVIETQDDNRTQA